MAVKTKATLLTEAEVIRDETVKNANTAARVGQHVYDIIDSVDSWISSISTGGGPAIENRYADIAALLADQANQSDQGVQYVADASTDTTVDSGYAYYEYKGTTVGDLTDYRKLSEEEAMQFADDSIWEHIFFAALSPDFGVITRPWAFKVTVKTDTGGTATITTSADAAYTLGTTVTAGGYLKVTGGTLNMRSSLKVVRA